jgi:thiol-disulfide isomerase/thioredoxin
MKKIILGVLVFLIMLTLIFLVKGIVVKLNKKKQIAEQILRLPSFSFSTLSKKSFSSSEIKEGPVLIVRYHPECDHCKYEILELLESNIPDIVPKIYLVSSADPDSIKGFIKQFHLSDYPAITPLVDTAYLFGDIFGSEMVPSNYIYDEDLNLIKVFLGEVKTETILKYVRGSE